MSPAPKKATAVEKLRASVLRPTQLEMLGDDVDLRDLYLALNHKDIDIEGAVLDVVVDRTIQGASTVTVTVEDRDRVLLQSGRLSARNDIEIDGLFFRLASVQKSAEILTLAFEDREVALLRRYNKPIKQSLSTSRQKLTRAEFVLRMIREVKETKIKYVIPHLTKVQPIGKLNQVPADAAKIYNRSYGIPKINDLAVKGHAMSESQRKVANAVLDTGISNLVPLNDATIRKILVMSMMAAIQESSISNLGLNPNGSGSRGVFQQIKKYGWPASGDVATDAAEFFKRLRAVVSNAPNIQYYAAIQDVQRSGFPTAYAQWRTEAERIVTQYGLASGSTALVNSQFTDSLSAAQGDYEFYRGVPPTKVKTQWGKESSWDCIQRLANEVQWRAFFVSGTFYYISDDELLKSQPVATLDESSKGVRSIDGDYAEGTKSATVNLTCDAGRWVAPPGSVITLQNMGPWNGRWLVNDISRSLFSPTVNITLKKKQPRLPEPATSNIAKSGASDTWTGAPPAQPSQHFAAVGLVQPVPSGFETDLAHVVHPTLGLEGYPAIDFGGSAGAPVIAVESGKIVRLSGHPPSLGAVDPITGVHGPFGWSVYLLGDSGSEYYYTHLGSRTVSKDEKVTAGQEIGTIGNYAQVGGVNHTHVGVHPAASGHPDINDLNAAPLARPVHA